VHQEVLAAIINAQRPSKRHQLQLLCSEPNLLSDLAAAAAGKDSVKMYMLVKCLLCTFGCDSSGMIEAS
jgi:hypothetical protein